MFGRKQSDDSSLETPGEPTPAGGRIRPDDLVLDELSRAFGPAGDDADDRAETSTGSGTSIAPDGSGQHDITAAAEPDPLAIATELAEAPESDDADPGIDADPPRARTTISIGGDEVVSGFVDAVSLDEAMGRHIVAEDPSGSGARPTIAIGTDDDLPDTMYLDDDVVLGDGSGGTVFIDDDGTGDAIAPRDATAQGIEPRIRQRRIGVRRAASRRRLKWVGLGIVALLFLLAALTLLGSGLFAISDVSVGGNVYTDRERLDAVIDDLKGTPVLLADTRKAELELEAIPWVANARVRTKFPNKATIEIRERTPVATMRGEDGLFRVIDATGRVLDVIEGQPVAFILISGPGTLDLDAGEFAPIGPSSAASLVTRLTPTIRPRVESFEVTDDGSELIINLAPAENSEQTSPIRVRFGSAIGDTDQIEKLVRLENKLDDLPDGVVTEINVATAQVTVL